MLECGCSRAGTNHGVNSCSTLGECKCKAFVEEGGKCTVCEDGHYGLKDENIFGCSGELITCCLIMITD